MSQTKLQNSLPSVAVIIPTCGRSEQLKCCLRKILPYVQQNSECVVVVSDDGDASQTRARLDPEFEQVILVQGPRRGPAANRNSGVEHSTGDLLIFLDDDCRPEPNLIEEYRRAAAQHPDCSVFEGRISAEGRWTSFADMAPVNESGGYLWSCNIAVRRDLYRSIGGFDERFPFPAMEDADLKFRVEKRSPIRFLPEARVFHDVERRAGWRRLKHNSLSVLLYIHLHGRKATRHSSRRLSKAVARMAIRGLSSYVRRRVTDDLSYLLLSIWASMLILIAVSFWRFHPFLAKRFFPACCVGCRSIHASLVAVKQ